MEHALEERLFGSADVAGENEQQIDVRVRRQRPAPISAERRDGHVDRRRGERRPDQAADQVVHVVGEARVRRAPAHATFDGGGELFAGRREPLRPPTLLGCGDVLHHRLQARESAAARVHFQVRPRLQRVAGDERGPSFDREPGLGAGIARACHTRRMIAARSASLAPARSGAGKVDAAVAYRHVKSCPSAVSPARSQSTRKDPSWTRSRRSPVLRAARCATPAPRRVGRSAPARRSPPRCGRDILARHDPGCRPARGAADVHVFDEADLGAEAAGVGDEVDQLRRRSHRGSPPCRS